MDKRELHGVLQTQAQQMVGVPPTALLSRWVLIREVVLPDSGEKCLNFVTSDASGQALTVWDAESLLRGHLRELVRQSEGMRRDWPEPPPGPEPTDDMPF